MVDPQDEIRFLEEHKHADVIICDAETKRPVAVEYLTCQGRPRAFPIRYWINGDSENIDLSQWHGMSPFARIGIE